MREDQNNMVTKSVITDIAGFDDIQKEVSIFLKRLFDIMFPVGVFLGGIALTASIYRSIHYGWYCTLLLNVGMYLSAVIILIVRRHLSPLFMFAVLIGLICVEGIHSLYYRGLASSGMMSLTVACIFTGVFLGRGAGIVAVAIGAIIASLCGIGLSTGILKMNVDINDPLMISLTWIVDTSLFVMYVVCLVLTVNDMQRRIIKSLNESKETASRLKDEIEMRKQIEYELRKSENKYRSIFDNAVEGIFQTTTEGDLISANPALARMAGFDSPEELIKDIHDLGHRIYVYPKDRMRLFEQLAEHGFVEGFETQLYRKDYTVIWASVNARAVYDDGGKMLYIEGSIEDITKRKRIERDLLESEAKYRSVVESSLVGFCIVQDDTFRFVNRRFCDISGFGYHELVDIMKYMDLIHPDYRAQVAENIKRRIQGDSAYTEYDFKAIRKDGTVITVKSFASLFSYGGRIALFGTFIDITQEKTLEAQLRQAQKMEAIGTFAGGIAHDFNNILTALIGYGTLIQARTEQTDRLHLYADQILCASHKGVNLTQSLLAFSRKRPISLKPVGLNTIIRGTEKLLKRLITEDITLETHLSENDTTILADSTQIDQILFNLTTNARDAMPRGGTLGISSKMVSLSDEFILSNGFGKIGRYALLSVSDTGVGMDKKTLEKSFDPFFTTKEVGKGTGLGLSTVYGIVKQHNGYITVESEPNRGTLFHIYLPAVEAEEEEDQPRCVDIRGGFESILVAEDSPEARHFVKEILDQYGYTVIEAVDGEDAVAKFQQHDGIDLVIMDSIMPKLNGKEAYDVMRLLRPNTNFIFMSGYTKDIILDKGIAENEFNFLPKPLIPELLLKKIREILDREDAT